MKTLFITLSFAALLVAGIALTGQLLQSSVILAVAFAACLAGWAFAESMRDIRPCTLSRPERPRLFRSGRPTQRSKPRAPARLAT